MNPDFRAQETMSNKLMVVSESSEVALLYELLRVDLDHISPGIATFYVFGEEIRLEFNHTQFPGYAGRETCLVAVDETGRPVATDVSGVWRML